MTPCSPRIPPAESRKTCLSQKRIEFGDGEPDLIFSFVASWVGDLRERRRRLLRIRRLYPSNIRALNVPGDIQ
tara:strand:+ start:1104 stop:1322 length:219 start_codon:yes stop_codon:yes gene_type:complete